MGGALFVFLGSGQKWPVAQVSQMLQVVSLSPVDHLAISRQTLNVQNVHSLVSFEHLRANLVAVLNNP